MAKENSNSESSANTEKQTKGLLILVMIIALAAPFIAATMAGKSIKAEINKIKEKSGPEKEHKAETGPPQLVFYQPMEFLVNLADTEESRYLRTTVRLGIEVSGHEQGHAKKAKKGHGSGGGEEDSPALAKIKTQEPVIRDTVISVISNYTMNALVSAKGKNELKETLRIRLQSKLRTKNLEVFFTAFTLQ